jgi:hypothetical protein
MVDILLSSGARGPVVDALLRSIVNSAQKDLKLIELLVKYGADVTEELLCPIVSQGLSPIVKILINAKLTVQTCFAALLCAVNLQSSEPRYDIIKSILTPDRLVGFESISITQAVVDTLLRTCIDVALLKLLCQRGRPDVNLLEWRALILATQASELSVFEVVLITEGCLPTASTVGLALVAAINLPLHDPWMICCSEKSRLR